jgi:hypothetical protein
MLTHHRTHGHHTPRRPMLALPTTRLDTDRT